MIEKDLQREALLQNCPVATAFLEYYTASDKHVWWVHLRNVRYEKLNSDPFQKDIFRNIVQTLREDWQAKTAQLFAPVFEKYSIAEGYPRGLDELMQCQLNDTLLCIGLELKGNRQISSMVGDIYGVLALSGAIYESEDSQVSIQNLLREASSMYTSSGLREFQSNFGLAPAYFPDTNRAPLV